MLFKSGIECNLNQVSNVQEVIGDGVPLADHHLLSAQLPRRLQQQGGHSQVRKQRYEHSPVQLHAASLLAPQFYGRLHLVAPLRRRKRFSSFTPFFLPSCIL